MTRRGALLLLPLAVLGLAAGAPAGPADSLAPGGKYECCLDASAKFLTTPQSVVTLDLCKQYCDSNKHGSPVYRGGAWLCAPTAEYTCSGVATSFCESAIANLAGYFRLYPLSFFTTRNVESLKKSTGGDTSSSATIAGDLTVRTRQLAGGSATDLRRQDGVTRVDVVVKRDGLLGINSLTGQTRNFGGSESTIIGDRTLINLGTTGRANLTRSIDVQGRFTDRTVNRDIRVGTQTEGSQIVKKPDGGLSVQTQRTIGSENTAGTDNNQQRTDSNINTTNLSVRGTAQADSSKLVGVRHIDGIGDLTRNIDTTQIRGTGIITNAGTGVSLVNRQSVDNRQRLDATSRGTRLRTETIDTIGTTKQLSESGGQARVNTDAVNISKEGVGSILQEKNDTIGTQGSKITTIDSQEKLVTKKQTSDCPTCASTGTEVTNSKEDKDKIVVANSDFKDSALRTSTIAGGKRLDLLGRTRTEFNGTQSFADTRGRSFGTRDSRVEAGCDKKAGGCNLVTQNSGTTTVISRNTTSDKDDVQTKTNVISVATFG